MTYRVELVSKVGITVVITAALLVSVEFIANVGKVTGFHIEPSVGGNCVVIEERFFPDPNLFCSSDIYAVEDALRRYRSMPLGDRRIQTEGKRP